MRIDKHTQLTSTPAALADHPAYRRDIDGLRALAVLSVLGFHAFPGSIRGGFVGVDIFFIISGFLISSILLAGLERGSFRFAEFYARRIKRIFPALIVVMAACLAFGWFALFPDEYQQLGKHVVGGAGFVSNFVLWNEVGYFDTAAETKPLLHLWSLGIEEQFYILWPLLLFAFHRRVNALTATLLLAAASFALNVGGIAHHASATFYSPASRAWELWLGAALACLTLKRGPLFPATAGAGAARLASLLSLLGLALIVLAMCNLNKQSAFPGWWALAPALGAALIIAAGPRAWVNRTLLAHPVAVWFGLISYPLYLWHWPLLSFAQIVESGTPSLAIRATAAGAAVLLAWLTYLLIEKPLRFGLAWRGKTAALALTMTALAAVGGLVWQRAGLPQRASIVENAQQQKALVLVEDVENAKQCKARYGFASFYEYCLLAHVDRAPTVAMIGDSHAYHIVAGLTKYYDSIGENLLYLGTRWPYWDIDGGDDGYQLATPRMLDVALNTDSVKTVIISTAIHVEDQSPGGKHLIAAMRTTIERYRARGKHIIFVNDIPKLDFEPRACIKRAGIASSTTKAPCAMKRADFDRETAVHYALIRKILADYPDVETFDTAPYLCDQDYCWAMLGGKMLYRDTHHLSYDGDLMIGAHFAEEQQRKRGKSFP